MNPQASEQAKIRVLMVCLGNICRSPTAHGVFQKHIDDNDLSYALEVDSAGTSRYHIGEPPDSRSSSAASQRGYDLSAQRARQLADEDYQRFDYILAMDSDNLREIEARRPSEARAETGLLLDFAKSEEMEVPDPYYSGGDGFEIVLNLVEDACLELLAHIKDRHEHFSSLR